jgi:uncharacterized membrane protein YeaQ/YmgE (transglycosylase-associated protein family)
MGCFHFLAMLIVGCIVGLIARAVMPGMDHLGFWMTCGLGIAGSVVGGVLGALISRPEPGSKFHPAGFFLSIVGSVLILFVWHLLRH